MRERLRRMAQWTGKRWIGTVALVSAACGGLLAVVGVGVAEPGWQWPVAAAAGTLGAGWTGWAVLVLYREIREPWETDQLRGLVNVRPLTGELPVDLDEWAADPAFADEVVRRLVGLRPRRVVECGSGWTTVLMAACLGEIGRGRVVALEHEQRYADRTRELLAAAGCADRATVIHAPLEPLRLEGQESLWYSLDRADGIEAPIDVLVVDGPPASVAPAARRPGVPVLRDRLGDDWVILLDDGFRREEAEIARSWGRLLGVQPKLRARGEGIWVLESRSSSESRDAGGAVTRRGQRAS